MDRVVEIDPTYAKTYLVLWTIDQVVALGIDRAKVKLNIAGTSPSP